MWVWLLLVPLVGSAAACSDGPEKQTTPDEASSAGTGSGGDAGAGGDGGGAGTGGDGGDAGTGGTGGTADVAPPDLARGEPHGNTPRFRS